MHNLAKTSCTSDLNDGRTTTWPPTDWQDEPCPRWASLLVLGLVATLGWAAPAIRLISPYLTPTEGWTVHGSIAFAVDARDSTGIADVTFTVDGVSAGTDRTYPYGILWNTRSTSHVD